MAEMMTTDVRALLDRDPVRRLGRGRPPRGARPRPVALPDAPRRRRRDPRPREGGDDSPRPTCGWASARSCWAATTRGSTTWSKAGDVGLAHFFRGLALENLQRWDEAAEAFAAAGKAGYDPKSAELHRAGALRRAGQVDEARKILDGLEKLAGSSAEYHYQRGSLLAAEGELAAAAAEFEKALSLDRDHTGALFELAYINDLYGNDDDRRRLLQAVHRSGRPSRWPR